MSVLAWETFGENEFIADRDDGSCYYAELDEGVWHFEWWSPSGVLLADKKFLSFEAGCFEMCSVLKFEGWTIDGVKPDLN